MALKPGDTIRIVSLKHGGSVHRIWKKSVILRTEEPMILANHHAEVVEKNGDEWIYPHLAICHFSKENWFHTVVVYDDQFQLKEFYTNLASPYWLDVNENTLYYVDYDLDLIVSPSFRMRWVDEDEYLQNSKLYGYPESVQAEIIKAREQLEERVHARREPFTPDFAPFWYHRYLELKGCR